MSRYVETSGYLDSLTGNVIRMKERNTTSRRDVIAIDPGTPGMHTHVWHDRRSGQSGILIRSNH